MASHWRKAKKTLGLNLCVYVPRTLDDDPVSPAPPSSSSSSAALLLPPPLDSPTGTADFTAPMPTTPTPTSSGLKLSKSGSRSASSKNECSICLTTMKPGDGHALFTAECSHVFHFHCIASSIKHGNRDCPICRAKWNEIPFQGPLSCRAKSPPVVPQNRVVDDGHTVVFRRLHSAISANRQRGVLQPPSFLDSDSVVFNDDEPVDSMNKEQRWHGCVKAVEMEAEMEFAELAESDMQENFIILIHLRGPPAQACGTADNLLTARAPIDLVTVLDVSGSMAGTKLALLKQAMGFVIRNLGSSDRLSVIAFSSTARRLFPLICMSESGRQRSLQAVNSLVSNGGTNIADGLKKGVRVFEERKNRNPVCSIILLSDGQDTYTVTPANNTLWTREYAHLLPSRACRDAADHVPVHVFGFGVDHDSASLHSISESSGGTFSFIEAEATIQDAFAQCIGGLLSVVAQELVVDMRTVQPEVLIRCIKSGSYGNWLAEDHRSGSISVGCLYAEEERDFLVSVNVPQGAVETQLLEIGCCYKDSLTEKVSRLERIEVKIPRPMIVMNPVASIKVDRHRNRLRAADIMAEARAAAEHGELAQAVSLLEDCRRGISESPSGKMGDQLCLALDAELKQMQKRMASQQKYEASGRAYMLSGLSTHSWQRATTRGDSTDSTSLICTYRTTSMTDMLQRSQTMSPARGGSQQQQQQQRQEKPLVIRQSKSFTTRPRPAG